MYFVFAWYEGQELGGQNDLLGAYETLQDAIEAAEIFAANRLDFQVCDSDLNVIFDSLDFLAKNIPGELHCQ